MNKSKSGPTSIFFGKRMDAYALKIVLLKRGVYSSANDIHFITFKSPKLHFSICIEYRSKLTCPKKQFIYIDILEILVAIKLFSSGPWSFYLLKLQVTIIFSIFG